MVDGNWLYHFSAMALFVIGLYALIVYSHLMRKILAVNIMGSAVFLAFVSNAYDGFEKSPDPVPHAMVLTGIVVAISTTALALVLAGRIQTWVDRSDVPDSDREGEREI